MGQFVLFYYGQENIKMIIILGQNRINTHLRESVSYSLHIRYKSRQRGK